MPKTTGARYADVLKFNGVLQLFGFSLLGRSAFAFVFLPLLFSVTEATGSVALGGATVALYGASASFLAPIRAWFIDRFGAARVLPILVVLFSCAIGSIALASMLSASGGVFALLGVCAGSLAPPLGPTMRVAWSALSPSGDFLKKAMSLDAVIEELLYLLGPAFAGLALTLMSPGILLVFPAMLVCIGGLCFVKTPTISAMHSRAFRHGKRAVTQKLPKDLRYFGVLAPVLCAGAFSGALGILIPGHLMQAAGSAVAGLALGCFAGGSVIGGLLFGKLNLAVSYRVQLTLLTLALATILSSLVLVAHPIGVIAVLICAGLCFSPIMILGYLAAAQLAGKHWQNAATTWVNTSHNLGAALGGALAGLLLQQLLG